MRTSAHLLAIQKKRETFVCSHIHDKRSRNGYAERTAQAHELVRTAARPYPCGGFNGLRLKSPCLSDDKALWFKDLGRSSRA